MATQRGQIRQPVRDLRARIGRYELCPHMSDRLQQSCPSSPVV